MTSMKKGALRKTSARMRRLREMRIRMREESKNRVTREQVAILLRILSAREIVQR